MSTKPEKPIQERFLENIDKQGSEQCWLWKGSITKKGYGKISHTVDHYVSYLSVHRLSYEIHVGPIPKNGHIIQTCGIRHCVNPDHLQLKNENVASRFWSKVQKQDGDQCWLWMARCDPNGYGIFTCTGNKQFDRAHRFAYELTYGNIPDGMFVCHKCDNPQCMRPDHMFLGTQKDNLRDMVNKGRNHFNPGLLKKGEQHTGITKLKDDEVREIKRLISNGMEGTEIAIKFQVHKSTISDIKRGRTWRHIH